MMRATSRRKPVLPRTVAFVTDYVGAHGLRTGDRLPTTRGLAELAGVSYLTMLRAVRELRKTGSLSLGKGRRIVAADPVPKTATVSSSFPEDSPGSKGSAQQETRSHSAKRPPKTIPEYPWQLAVGRIRRDIVNRVFPPGVPLPSVKELQARYHVTYRTLHKALQHLSMQESLEPLINGGYAAPSFSASRWRTRIVCLVRSIDSMTMTFGTNDEAAFSALEALCEQAQVKLEIYLICVQDMVQYYQHRETGRMLHEEDLQRLTEDSILGFVYWIPWQPSAYDREAIPALCSTGKPVVVIDESGMESFSADAFSGKKVRIFNVATSPRHGEAVARYLLRLGHEKIAFISNDHGYTWSQRRFEQVAATYGKAGFHSGVQPFVAAAQWNSHEFGEKRSDFGALYQAYQSWSAHLPAELRGDFDVAMQRMRSESCRALESRVLLLPLIDHALSDRSITAWIAVNDSTARMALGVLKEKKVHVPRELSIISFDDSLDAMRSNLSSYDFNAPAVAAGILGFLVGRKPYADPGAEVAGFIVDRGSVGPVTRH